MKKVLALVLTVLMAALAACSGNIADPSPTMSPGATDSILDMATQAPAVTQIPADTEATAEPTVEPTDTPVTE